MKFKKILVAGGGVLGSQIALMSAYTGHDVTIYLRSEASVQRTCARLDRYRGLILADLEDAKQLIGNPMAAKLYPKGLISDWDSMTPEAIDELLASGRKRMEENIHIELDLAKAAADADAVIEAIAEDPEQKIAFYESLKDLLPENAIICTNSSTLLPSTFAPHMKRPERFCAMHFANSIWKRNTAEVMGHEGTSPEVYDQVVELAREINMIPLKVRKERSGYLLNSMLIPFQWAALHLWAEEAADAETIDMTWELATGAPSGPLSISDRVGLETIYNINLMMPGSDEEGTPANLLGKKLKEKIDRGETGANAGIGFFDYRK
ncbi:MAG: 3-hydroxyacyl-CoA dehydrogenase [Parasporobacterium sp.]|nr:3-hydroxyacyl-CoA dehydrogenase [Parasporobacterium sp.]